MGLLSWVFGLFEMIAWAYYQRVLCFLYFKHGILCYVFEKCQYPDFAWDPIFSEKMTTIIFFGDGKNIYGGRCYAFVRGCVEDGVMVVSRFLGKMGD